MLKLTKQQKTKTGIALTDLTLSAVRNRRDAELRRQGVRRLYYGDFHRVDTHWDGASNINFPMLREKIRAIVEKSSTALLGATPIVQVRRPADDPDPKGTRLWESFLNWGLENDIRGFNQTIEQWIRGACLDPVSTVRIDWNQKWRTTVSVERVKSIWKPGDVDFEAAQVTEDRAKEDDEILATIFAGFSTGSDDGILETRKLPDGSYSLDFIEESRPFYDIRVSIDASEFVDEANVTVVRPVLEFNAPDVQFLEFEDVILPYRAEDIQTSPWVAIQYWLTPKQIEDKVKSKDWSLTPTELKRVRAGRSVDQEEDPENDSAKREVDDQIGEYGYPNSGTLHGFQQGKVLCLEVFMEGDVGDTGVQSQLVYQVVYGIRSVARVDYLDAIYPHRHRPFASIRYEDISNRWYGASAGEMLAPLNVQVNTTLNQVNDAQELINNPFWFREVTALTGNEMEVLGPGMSIPVNNINGILFPKWAQQPLANMSVGVDPMLMMADRLTVSPLSGGSTQMRNSPRTARGMLALISEDNSSLDHFVKRIQDTGWHELIYQISALYQAYSPDQRWFYVTGEKANRKHITQRDMAGRWEFIFRGNTINTNREIQRVLAMQRYQMGMNNPLYATDPLAMQELLRETMQAYSDGTEVDRIIPRLPGEGNNPHPPMPQQQENRAMVLGVHLDALPSDPHLQHVQEIDKFYNTAEFNDLNPEVVALLAMHRNQHEQMYRAMIAQQRQAGDGGGGGEQSVGPGSDLGNLEGGVQ